MATLDLGINLSFAVKRWPEPEAWARLVREDLELDSVQFTFDLLDPWWPEPARSALAAQVRRAAEAWQLRLDSAFVGLAAYTYNGLLHPEPAARKLALEWWRNAIRVASELGAQAVGGPLGGLSMSDAKDPGRLGERRAWLLEAVAGLSREARARGLREILIEPTPLRREIPHGVEEARQLVEELGQLDVPVRYVLDVGHAHYRPLYGEAAGAGAWLTGLGELVAVVHVQNTDFQSDSHWGWPDPRGTFDVAALARQVKATGICPRVFLEVMYPFEADDQAVLANVRSSVDHCRRAMAL